MIHKLAFVVSVSLAIGGFALVPRATAQESSHPPAPSQTSPPLAPQPPASSSSKQKPAKVWTNDNVADAGGAISVVGSSNSASNAKGGAKNAPKPASTSSVDPRVVASLRDQLQRLQAQLNIVTRQYSDLKAQSKGEAKSAGGLQANTFNYDSSSVEEQLKRLQEKKKRLEDSIDQLLDAARKAGIEPGALR